MSFSPCPDPILGDRTVSEAVELLVVPRAVDLGEMTVRRALPSAKRQMVGPFIFFDQMGPAEFLTDQGIDVRPHPHINLSTLTYLLEGEILHRDSLGTEMAIQPGAVNWMKAGKGIVHSERTSDARKASGQTLFGLQTWMALPTDQEESDPAFIHHSADALPVVDYQGITARVIAGNLLGEQSPLTASSETLYADVLLKAGAQLPVDTCYDERALYVLSGTLSIGTDSFEQGQLVILRRGSEAIVKARQDVRFMLFGGDPMEGPRYIWWNFVSSRRERIELAKEEWAKGLFDTVPGDEEQFIPLPEKN
jgi:redox-sensitive bicupin YhaK (pirin superfamily)